MSMTKERAKIILTGYMAPRNWAISAFAQRGAIDLQSRLEHEVKQELKLKNEEAERARGDMEAEPRYRLEAEELDHILTWLKLRSLSSRPER